MCGPIAVVWSCLGLALVWGPPFFSGTTHDLVVHFKTFLAGMVLGLLVLLFASGDFAPTLRGKGTRRA
jgi:hypothetical protein